MPDLLSATWRSCNSESGTSTPTVTTITVGDGNGGGSGAGEQRGLYRRLELKSKRVELLATAIHDVGRVAVIPPATGKR